MKKTIILSLLIAVISCTGNKEPKRLNENRSETVDLSISETKIDTTALIERTIKEIKEDSIKLFSTKFSSITDNHEMYSSITYLKGRDLWEWMIENDKDIYEGNKTIDRLSKLIKSKGNATLSSVLPAYRKSFAKNLANGLWERDIYVTSSGPGSTILNMTGGIFASNANIKTFQETLEGDAKHYKFTQVRYRWYKDASEYTYYDISK